MNTIHGRLREAERDCSNLNSQVHEANKKIESLRQQLAEAQEQVDLQIPKEVLVRLRQQLAECQATNGMLRAVISENHEWHKLYDIYDGYIESDLASSNSRALALPNDATALNELIAERTKELTAEVERKMSAGEFLIQQNAELTAQRDAAEDEAGRMRAESADARGYALDLERRLQTAEADAKRYRMIRRGQHWSVINGIGDDIRGEILDEAIDAAIANCKEPGK